MIIKERDQKNTALKQLNELLSCEITPKQRFLIEREIKSIVKGESGESDAAYFIDFYYKDSKNWAVIHDLRIEYNGLVAQIDHLLINRLFDFFILESKSFGYGVKINDSGEFEAIWNGKYYGIDSPIEQNKRHIHLLDKFLKEMNILPKRLGITINPHYLNYILVSPKSVIKRPKNNKFNTDSILKADTLRTEIDKLADKIPTTLTDLTSVVKVSSSSTIEELGKKIASFHKPSRINYSKKFGVSARRNLRSVTQVKIADKNENSCRYYCAKCKAGISEKVAKYCWNNKNKFSGKAYCYNCQKQQQKL